MRVRPPMLRLATVAGMALAAARAAAQEDARRTVRPETWPEAGRWPAPAWLVVLVGSMLVLAVLFGLYRHLRRGRR